MSRTSPLQKVHASSMSRTNSSPGNFESSIDRPMRLAEIYVASEHALCSTVSDPELWESFSSIEEFEVSIRKHHLLYSFLSSLQLFNNISVSFGNESLMNM